MVGKITLSILQQNVGKSFTSMMEIFDDADNLKYDIIAIQEPWRNSQYNATCNPVPDRFEVLYYNAKTTRTALFVNKDIALASWSVTHRGDDFSTLKLKTNDVRIINIHIIYNPGPGTLKSSSSMILLENISRQHPGEEHIALGDYNLHHVAWGGVDIQREDSGAEVLLEIAETHRMKQLLTPETITYSERGANSTIGLVFATPLLTESLIKCRTKPDIYSSDHFPIETVFNLHTIQQSARNTRQYRKTDIGVLQESMRQELQTFPSLSLEDAASIDERENLLVSAITRSIEKSTPMTRICKHSKPGFDAKCKETAQKVRRLHKLYQEEDSEEAWEEYKLGRNWKKDLIRKMKRRQYRESREKACESPATVWRACKISKREGPPPQACTPAIRGHEGHMENDPIEKLRLLKKSFFPPPPTVRLEDSIGFSYPAPLGSNDITKVEIMRAIKRPSPFKAPGPSGIPNRILQLLAPLLLPELHTLYNACYAKGYCPKAFRNSVTVVLKKPESDDPENPRDYSEPKSYRPIALLETIGKVYETIIAARIAWMAETHNLLPGGHMGDARLVSMQCIHWWRE